MFTSRYAISGSTILTTLLFGCQIVLGQGPANVKAANAKADGYVRRMMSKHHIPGVSLMVLRKGKPIHTKNYGFADLENSVAVTSWSVFQICSITKSLTAIGVMLLAEDGKLSVDDLVIRHLPYLSKSGNEITIRQLLSHTSGITAYENRPEAVGQECADTLPDLENWLKNFDLASKPGDEWAYQNTGYAILGKVIEQVSGRAYGDFLHKRIFEPLGMNDTRMLNYDDMISRRVSGYIYRDGKYLNGPNINTEVEAASGGLVSTTLDLARLDAALFTEKLLKQKTLKEMWSPARLAGGRTVDSYGLGFGLSPYKGKSRVGHTGGCPPGFSTAFQRFTDDRVSVILLTNADQEPGFIGNASNEIAYFYLRK
ncbi:MAG: serine hydrolase domain-containing protein [Pyrinomonadaceae bacterium]